MNVWCKSFFIKRCICRIAMLSILFLGEGASTSPCSDTYRGPSSNSEPIIKGSTDFLMNMKQSGTDFVNFIDFHSYSQLFLYPWSYSARAALPLDTADHVRINYYRYFLPFWSD